MIRFFRSSNLPFWSHTQLLRQIDVLILNAGIYTPIPKVTEDGHQTTFQVNHLAQFYLTQLLMPIIRRPARVVVVSSLAHKYKSNIFVIDLQDLQITFLIVQWGMQGISVCNWSLINIISTVQTASFRTIWHHLGKTLTHNNRFPWIWLRTVIQNSAMSFSPQSLLDVWNHKALSQNSLHPGVIKTNIANHDKCALCCFNTCYRVTTRSTVGEYYKNCNILKLVISL